MAEARADEEEQNVGETREPVVRRQPRPSTGGDRPDRRKPEHRHSHGPLSSIRAVIKRTNTRSTSISEEPRDRDRERDRERNRRRPEITILSAEPLASTSWFPGVSGGFPPPPPPAAQIWGATIPPSIQPPPSYEEVIREKTQEQSSSVSTATSATQTERRSPADPQCTAVRRPSHVDDITAPRRTADTQTEPPPTAADLTGAERPRPRPRSALGQRQPISGEVKVQTLVKLGEDGAATLAARVGHAREAGQGGTYLQELLEAFSSDDWGFPDHRSDHSGLSQSESEEEEGEEEMGTLKARIQAFQQQQSDGCHGDSGNAEDAVAKRPEPLPRPRLQGKPAKPGPPVVAPKPKPLCDDGPDPDPPTQTPRPPPPPKHHAPYKPPPRPRPAPRASVGGGAQDRSSVVGPAAPRLPPRPERETPAASSTVSLKTGRSRPDVPTKPRPLVGSKPSQTPPGPGPGPPAAGPGAPSPGVKLATPAAPAPALRRSPLSQVKVAPPDPALTAPHRAPVPTAPPDPALMAPHRAPVPTAPPDPALTAPHRAPVPTAPPDPALMTPRPTGGTLLPLRPPPIKTVPERPPPPTVNTASSSVANQMPPPMSGPALPISPAPVSPAPSAPPANHMQGQRAPKKGPPLPPRPKPGHALYDSYMKREVLVVVDDQRVNPPQTRSAGEVKPPSPLQESPCLLDVDIGPEHLPGVDSQSKGISDIQSGLNVQTAKQNPEPSSVSGPRCVAKVGYHGEEEELTFCQGDVIALLEPSGQEWGRGQIHGPIGTFPLKLTEVPEAVKAVSTTTTDDVTIRETAEPTSTKEQEEGEEEEEEGEEEEEEEWAVALFNFPGQTAEDLSFQQGAVIRVIQHVDAEWRRGRVEDREGLYPVAFTQPYTAQPIPGQQAAIKGVARALFDFTAEREDELTVKTGDVVTDLESVDEQWIMGVVDGKCGIVPKNFLSPL